ncbi:putative Efflux transporter, RND family, MFP subunit [Candidatus Zixiibacteriota bacterium]|nr:putative Efflux transporter, RND family, MFP subunit [candidate division Zixibacteria bacterium]
MRNYMSLSGKKIWGATVISIISLIAGCSGGNQNGAASQLTISVKGELIVPASRELTRTFTGSLEGEKQAVILAKISEAVEKIYVHEGNNVRAGDLIVSLDKSGPTSNYLQAMSVFKNSEKNYNKMKTLYDQGAISEYQFDGAKTDYEVSRANYEAAEQMVDLSSPISGTVTAVDVSLGQYVAPGIKVATIAQIDRLRMKFGVSSVDIGYFNIGADVRVKVEAESLLVGTGKVVAVAKSADPVTRTFEIEVEVENSAHQFKPGMFAKCDIIIGRYDNVVIAPRTAVLSRGGKDLVFVYSGGKSVAKEVVRGVDFNGVMGIKSGLEPGDTLIIVGQDYAVDGGAVKLAAFVGADGKEIEL